jgi:hypothetical protein
MNSGTSLVIDVVSKLRQLAQAYPAASPKIQQINDLMREVSVEILKSQNVGETQAGVGG